MTYRTAEDLKAEGFYRDDECEGLWLKYYGDTNLYEEMVVNQITKKSILQRNIDKTRLLSIDTIVKLLFSILNGNIPCDRYTKKSLILALEYQYDELCLIKEKEEVK